ncbi:helix-turn-helix domain-containing protein [Pseudomaricurvus alkylphenolicus]|uniref:helix-turn-helix domain-containing protein n=1 Tax=Pseudomaricurvus alkylphenolicus TaxID=1306991 RepID=UPI001422EF05|nr:helix-turn-helix domain-containing protein [Pseudomaricurvus alkylphenolicus]
MGGDDDLLGQLRQTIAMLLPQGTASLEEVAQQMHVSKRTLYRKLEERGTSFRQLVEDYRREQAFCHMAEEDLSLGDISFLLGFSSSSNFTRAL